MRISDLLKAFAADLEREDNEAILLAEDNDESMDIVASALVEAAYVLKQAAAQVEEIEPQTESVITEDAIDEMAALAQAFEESGDELLKKQAFVIDEILATIAAPRGAKYAVKEAEDDHISELKKKYQEVSKEHAEINKKSDALKAIQNSEYYKKYTPLEAPLNTRYCPDHPGVLIHRVGEHRYQCTLDKKVYDWETGFKLENGNLVPGGNVQNQTPVEHIQPHSIFDTRSSRMGDYYQK